MAFPQLVLKRCGKTTFAEMAFPHLLFQHYTPAAQAPKHDMI